MRDNSKQGYDAMAIFGFFLGEMTGGSRIPDKCCCDVVSGLLPEYRGWSAPLRACFNPYLHAYPRSFKSFACLSVLNPSRYHSCCGAAVCGFVDPLPWSPGAILS